MEENRVHFQINHILPAISIEIYDYGLSKCPIIVIRLSTRPKKNVNLGYILLIFVQNHQIKISEKIFALTLLYSY